VGERDGKQPPSVLILRWFLASYVTQSEQSPRLGTPVATGGTPGRTATSVSISPIVQHINNVADRLALTVGPAGSALLCRHGSGHAFSSTAALCIGPFCAVYAMISHAIAEQSDSVLGGTPRWQWHRSRLASVGAKHSSASAAPCPGSVRTGKSDRKKNRKKCQEPISQIGDRKKCQELISQIGIGS
jgi:hypothetical protein